LLSTIWSLAVGLHTFASLLPGSHRMSPFLLWLRSLPLPNTSKDLSADWPILLGIIGMMAGVLMVGWSKHIERKKREQSEA
jgi:LPXTG-motif cell wall-anchored protein